MDLDKRIKKAMLHAGVFLSLGWILSGIIFHGTETIEESLLGGLRDVYVTWFTIAAIFLLYRHGGKTP